MKRADIDRACPLQRPARREWHLADAVIAWLALGTLACIALGWI